MKKEEFLSKIKIIRKILVEVNKKGIIFSTYSNLCWLGVKRPNVLSISENVVVKIIVTKDDIILVANNIEIHRILQEEIYSEIKEYFQLKSFQWYMVDSTILDYEKNEYIEDFLIEDKIKQHRIILSQSDIKNSIKLGKDIASIVENSLQYIKKGRTEREISGEMIKMCTEKEIDVGLALCASEKRMMLYRHPITTNTEITNVCMLALTVRREGIYSCISRIVSLKKPTTELINKRNAVLKVDCACEKYTQVGGNIETVFNKIQDTYKNVGYENEWKNHHQGGITGFASREVKITKKTNLTIKNNMIFAYNPTVAGYKTEDTFYLKDGKPIVTTFSNKLPLVEIDFEGEKFLKPDIIRLD